MWALLNVSQFLFVTVKINCQSKFLSVPKRFCVEEVMLPCNFMHGSCKKLFYGTMWLHALNYMASQVALAPVAIREYVFLVGALSLKETRRERLKSAPYLRLKKRKTLLEKNLNF